MKVLAKIVRWFHCMKNNHRKIISYEEAGKGDIIACDCGEIFYKSGVFLDFENKHIIEILKKKIRRGY